MLIQQLAGGEVSWGQLPVYLLAELAAGVVAGLAYMALSRTAADRARVPEQSAPSRTTTAADAATV
jgi:glycerol uptake facilitator protein